MELTSDIISSLGKQCKKDKKLATQVAKELFAQAEPLRVAQLIFNAKIAQELLIHHVQSNLAHTVAALSGEVAAKRTKAKKESSGQRYRMPEAEVKGLKKAVCSFLKKHPDSNRSVVQAAVKFPGLSAYNRIMRELVQEKAIKQKGERRNSVYAVR